MYTSSKTSKQTVRMGMGAPAIRCVMEQRGGNTGSYLERLSREGVSESWGGLNEKDLSSKGLGHEGFESREQQGGRIPSRAWEPQRSYCSDS